jgi:ribosome maturation factor RimP
LEVTVDKEGGITINECALLNRSIVSRVEKDDIHAEDFIIDVCSPGLDRELKSDSSFKWGMGKIVKVITGAEINGKTVIDGRLLEKTPEGDILIGRPDGTEVMIERNKVNKIKLVPEIK